jgi:hypothetical protein
LTSGGEQGLAGFVQKPFAAKALFAVLEGALGR